ncbi:MAG: TonB-dependent receptor [Candidatus Marinimicrobia bacterium]|nr:TonB-dependent receptor [Candidatus Neomarinimicrobiota bacterium]
MKVNLSIRILLLIVGLTGVMLQAGTTGKISGRIIDTETGLPLIGANVIVLGISAGAAADGEGYYVILNVAPGRHTVTASMIGYTSQQIGELIVRTDFTTPLDFTLTPTVLEAGQEVVVVGRRQQIQRDRTSTLSVIGADEIEKLPVRDVNEIIDLQAGVVDGHFRGGRHGEVAYMVDGISVSDPYDGAMAVAVENSAIQEIKVISGTFSAEYGQAMSGVVNIVTKTNYNNFKIFSDVFCGDYFTNHSQFLNNNNFNPGNNTNLDLTLMGPVPGLKNTGYFTSFRHFQSAGYLYGIEEFLPADSSNTDDSNPAHWYIERSGSGDYIAMNPDRKSTLQGKISTRLSPIMSLDLQGNYSQSKWLNYDHNYKYNPQGIPQQLKDSYYLNFSLTHSPSQKYFYTLKASQYFTDYSSYVYADPASMNYVNTQLRQRLGYGYYTGGMSMQHFYRNSRVNVFKFTLKGQPNRTNEISMGAEYRRSNLWLYEYLLRLDQSTAWKPVPYPAESVYNNRYRHIPSEFAFWLEDKVEWERLVLIAGVRFDYFEPDGIVPADLRDPDGSYYGSADPFNNAQPKSQWSPRLGISYPITDQGAIHISYCHFFQIPNFEYLYQNSEFKVAGGGLTSVIGNADLEPEKTVIYQFGLQQQLSPSLVLDLTGYYKDIRNLVGTEVYETYILGDSYARYENRDYGNVRGIAISLTRNPVDWFSGSLDYTFQIAEGNASDPLATFYDRQADPPRASEIQVVPLNWDQRHTLNLTLSIAQHNWGIGLIGKYGSGLPYTPEYQNQRTSFENSETKPAVISFDLNARSVFQLGPAKLTAYLQVKNLFDRENAVNVFADTGRPDYSLIPTYVPQQPIHSLEDFLTRPDYYSAPRQIVVGLKFAL